MRRTVGAIVLLAILVLHLALVQADDPKPKKPNSAPDSSKPKSLGLRCVFVSLAVCSVSRSVFISLSLTRTLSLSLSLYRARSFFLFPPCFLSFAHIHLLSFSPTVLFSFSFWLSLSYTRTYSVLLSFLRMCLREHIYTHTHTHAHAGTRIRTYTHAHTHTHTHTLIYIYICLYIYKLIYKLFRLSVKDIVHRKHTHAHSYAHTHTHAHTHTRTHVCIHKFIHIHCSGQLSRIPHREDVHAAKSAKNTHTLMYA